MDIRNKVEVIDNFIPKAYQDMIHQVLMGDEEFEVEDKNDRGFPWYYTEDIQQQVLQRVNIELVLVINMFHFMMMMMMHYQNHS